jgi:hypothetical protein
MIDVLFKVVHYSQGGLISDIGRARADLPEIQRSFVWAKAKVRATSTSL